MGGGANVFLTSNSNCSWLVYRKAVACIMQPVLMAYEFQSVLSIIWDQQFPEGGVGCRRRNEQVEHRGFLGQ